MEGNSFYNSYNKQNGQLYRANGTVFTDLETSELLFLGKIYTLSSRSKKTTFWLSFCDRLGTDENGRDSPQRSLIFRFVKCDLLTGFTVMPIHALASYYDACGTLSVENKIAEGNAIIINILCCRTRRTHYRDTLLPPNITYRRDGRVLSFPTSP